MILGNQIKKIILRNVCSLNFLKGQGLAKKHMCIIHGHRQLGSNGQREGGEGAGIREAKGGNGDSSKVSKIKIK